MIEKAYQKMEKEAEAMKMRRKIADLQDQLAKSQTLHISSPEPSPEDLAAIRKEVEAEYQSKLGETEAEYKKNLERLTREKAEAQVRAEKEAVKDVKALKEQLAEVEKKLSAVTEREEAALRKAKAAASADAQKLAVHFDLVQRELNSIKECLKNLAEDPAAEKYRNAVAKILRDYLTELEGGAE